MLFTSVYIKLDKQLKLEKIFQIVSGGNLGLFTGMSILSMIEIAFWITRIIFHVCPGQRKSKSKNESDVGDSSNGLGSVFDIIFGSNKDMKENINTNDVEDCPRLSRMDTQSM